MFAANKLKKLIKHFGSRQTTQEALGIKARTMSGILNSTKEKPYPGGKSLRILIEKTLADIKIRKLME